MAKFLPNKRANKYIKKADKEIKKHGYAIVVLGKVGWPKMDPETEALIKVRRPEYLTKPIYDGGLPLQDEEPFFIIVALTLANLWKGCLDALHEMVYEEDITPERGRIWAQRLLTTFPEGFQPDKAFDDDLKIEEIGATEDFEEDEDNDNNDDNDANEATEAGASQGEEPAQETSTDEDTRATPPHLTRDESEA